MLCGKGGISKSDQIIPKLIVIMTKGDEGNRELVSLKDQKLRRTTQQVCTVQNWKNFLKPPMKLINPLGLQGEKNVGNQMAIKWL